jgi:hypothetical protein
MGGGAAIPPTHSERESSFEIRATTRKNRRYKSKDEMRLVGKRKIEYPASTS